MQKHLKFLLSVMGLLTAFIAAFANPLDDAIRSSYVNVLQEVLLRQGYTVIPLELADTQNTLLAKIDFGDNKPHIFVIDTGCTYTRVDKSLVSTFNFKLGTGKLATTGADNKVQNDFEVQIPTLRLGGFISHNETAYAQDYSYIKIDNLPLAGMLGLVFLQEHHAIIDITGKRLYLKDSVNNNSLDADFVKKIITASNPGIKILQLDQAPSGHFTIPVQINQNKTVNFLFDTGLPETMLAQTYAQQLNLKISNNPITISGSGGGTMQVYNTVINNLMIGGVKWQSNYVGIMNFEFIQVGAPLYGAIGLDWMQANQAIIDVSNRLLFF